MVTWKAIPEDRAHGTIQGYVVKLDGTEDEIFVCPSPLKMTIGGLEKSNVYRLQMAGYTSKGQGNFSAYVLAITNIDGRLSIDVRHNKAFVVSNFFQKYIKYIISSKCKYIYRKKKR